MKRSVLFIGCAGVLLTALSCSKKETRDDRWQRLWDCNQHMKYDSTSLAINLIGSWEWTEVWSELFQKKADRIIVATFSADGTFKISESPNIVTNGKWNLSFGKSRMLEMVTDIPNDFFHGPILLCYDELLFQNSYLDGADNFFARIK